MKIMKAKEICDREAKGIPYVMIISYILDKGESLIRDITDEQIDGLEGNDFMTGGFMKAIVRAAREVVRNCGQDGIVRLIKAEWCCAGECYDPDLGQFVTDTNWDLDE